MKRLLLLLVCLTAPALAQNEYVALFEVSPTSAASVVTVQAPATAAARVVRFVRAYVYCAVVCDVSLERTGTAATSTALTPLPLLATGATAATKAWSASNVGTGTVIGKYSLAIGETRAIDLTGLGWAGNGTTKNLTLRSSSITGIIRIAIHFTEQN